MRPVIRLTSRIAREIRFGCLCLLTRAVGIGFLVAYLRNPDPTLTVRLLRAFGAQVGNRTIFKRSVYLDNVFEDAASVGDFGNLRIGQNCYIGDVVYMDLANRIEVGDNVVISARVSILTHADCNRSEALGRLFPRKCEPVKVGEGTWLGFNCTVLAGCAIGARSVIASGSTVVTDLPGNVLAAGLPATIKKQLVEP